MFFGELRTILRSERSAATTSGKMRTGDHAVVLSGVEDMHVIYTRSRKTGACARCVDGVLPCAATTPRETGILFYSLPAIPLKPLPDNSRRLATHVENACFIQTSKNQLAGAITISIRDLIQVFY